MRAWVVPCRYDPIVFECTQAIRTHHPDDHIVLVDSCSPDQTYLQDVDADTILTGNNGYHPGAYMMALEAVQADSWAFIHDSLIVQQPVVVTETTAVRWFDPFIPPDQIDHVLDHLAHMDINPNREWRGVFGTMLFCTDALARDLERVGFFSFPCTTKIEASATERTLGFLLPPVFNTFQGHQTDLHAQYDETYVRKVMKDRP